MFSIEDNSIYIAADSKQMVNLFINGKDNKTMIEPGYIKTSWFNNTLNFISEFGKTTVRLNDIKSSIIGWNWCKPHTTDHFV